MTEYHDCLDWSITRTPKAKVDDDDDDSVCSAIWTRLQNAILSLLFETSVYTSLSGEVFAVNSERNCHVCLQKKSQELDETKRRWCSQKEREKVWREEEEKSSERTAKIWFQPAAKLRQGFVSVCRECEWTVRLQAIVMITKSLSQARKRERVELRKEKRIHLTSKERITRKKTRTQLLSLVSCAVKHESGEDNQDKGCVSFLYFFPSLFSWLTCYLYFFFFCTHTWLFSLTSLPPSSSHPWLYSCGGQTVYSRERDKDCKCMGRINALGYCREFAGGREESGREASEGRERHV